MTTLDGDSDGFAGQTPDGVFLPYQSEAIALSLEHELVVIEKSRRVGITWGFAQDDVVTASLPKTLGGDDVLYIGPSLDMAREYIDYCAAAARAYAPVAFEVGEGLFRDQDPVTGESREIKAFRIDFAGGSTIQALTSAPRSLRGRQGRLRIDEAAFVDNLEELLKAGLAFLIWGGKVVVMSTHNGVDNPFNQLIQAIRSKQRAGVVQRITFDDAIKQGLYERVCLRSGERPTPEGQAAWIKKIRDIYGAAAEEELDVIPARGGGSWLSYDEVERAERGPEEGGGIVVRRAVPDTWAKLPEDVRNDDIDAWCEEHLAPVLATLEPRALYGLGADVARYVDLSVFWLLCERTDRSWWTPLVVELRNLPYSAQRRVLRFILDRLRRWSASIDKGGGGQDTAEQLQQLYGEARVAMVDMNAAWWLENGPPAKGRFEDSRVEIVRDRDIAADLRGLKVKGGTPYVPPQRTTVSAEGGQKGGKRHFDAAVAHVLAQSAMRSNVAEPFEAHIIASPQQAVLGRAFGSEARDDLIDSDLGVVRSAIWADGPGWGA